MPNGSDQPPSRYGDQYEDRYADKDRVHHPPYPGDNYYVLTIDHMDGSKGAFAASTRSPLFTLTAKQACYYIGMLDSTNIVVFADGVNAEAVARRLLTVLTETSTES